MSGIRELSSPNWQPIDTAPKDGTKIRVNHSKAVKGYDCLGHWSVTEERWISANAFISPAMRLYWQPDLWSPLEEARHDA